MLYEVITASLVAIATHYNTSTDSILGLTEEPSYLFDTEGMQSVITSYSIHYTKLYESRPEPALSAVVAARTRYL